MGRPAASVGAAAGRVSVWRRDSGARHGFTVAKRIPATCMVVVRGLRPLSVRCERRATAHYFMDINQLCLPGLLETLIGLVCVIAREILYARKDIKFVDNSDSDWNSSSSPVLSFRIATLVLV